MNTFTPILGEIGIFGVLVMIAARLLIFLFILSPLVLPTIVGIWKVFTKAGQPGWAVLIPFYNIIVLLRIAGLPWYWVFTPLILFASVGAGVLACFVLAVLGLLRIARRFGKGIGFTIGLTLLAPI
ncbi:MAG: DUF5684 domain-containing protein, partial [Verrucomicrobiota bacterium]